MRSIPERQAPLAFEYIRASLAHGHSLAKRLLESVQFEHGQAMSSLPAGVSMPALLDFRTGGKLKPDLRGALSLENARGHALTAVPRPSTDRCLVDFIAAYLQRNSSRICVFDDVISRPGDPPIRSDPRIFMFREEVYRVIRQPDMARPFILQTIRDADALWYFMCMGTSVPRSAEFLARRRFSKNDLRLLAENARWIALGAYDGEGYVIWQRNPEQQKSTAKRAGLARRK